MRKIGLSIMLVSAAIGALKASSKKRITALDLLNKAGVSSECLHAFEKVQGELVKQQETGLDIWGRQLDDVQKRRSEILQKKAKKKVKQE